MKAAAPVAAIRSARSELVLVAGGEDDPNLHSLIARLERERVRHRTLLVGPRTHPRLTWDLARDRLALDGKPLAPTAVFLRYDVFSHLGDGRPETASRAYAWFITLQGWAMARPAVRLLNRHHEAAMKPHQLIAAREAGLPIPRTLITNDLDALDSLDSPDRLDAARFVAKPVAGGDYTRPLAPLLAGSQRRGGAAASPAIVQERLDPPEVRVYRAGETFLSFDMASASLDYRETQDCTVTPIDNDPLLVAGLRRLTDALRLDFAAADFKGGKFLEVNSGPMFAAFDAVSDGAVSGAIVQALREP